MAKSIWRQEVAPLIAQIIAAERSRGATDREIRNALSKAFPYGKKENHPYRIWLDEINKQMKTRKPSKPTNQTSLF